jgi:hypothetical protein
MQMIISMTLRHTFFRGMAPQYVAWHLNSRAHALGQQGQDGLVNGEPGGRPCP